MLMWSGRREREGVELCFGPCCKLPPRRVRHGTTPAFRRVEKQAILAVNSSCL